MRGASSRRSAPGRTRSGARPQLRPRSGRPVRFPKKSSRQTRTESVGFTKGSGMRSIRRMGRISTGAWMGAAFLGALLLAVPILAVMGAGPEGTDAALRVTARWSLLIFWPAYAGRALRVLFGPNFDGIARHARDFG